MLSPVDLAGSCGFGSAWAEDLLQLPSPLPQPQANRAQWEYLLLLLLVFFFFAFALLQLQNAETNLASCIYFYKVPECPGCFANYLQLREIFSRLIKGNNKKAA